MLKKIFKMVIGLALALIVLVLSIITFIKSAPQFGTPPNGAHLENISKSSNYGKDQFKNLIPTNMDLDFKSGMSVMYDFLFKTGKREPDKALPVKFDKNPNHQSDSLSIITWYGHSAILLEIDEKKILIDPMLGPAASPIPFMTKRFNYESPIDLESIPEIDAIILSHDHYDHLDYQSIMKLKDKVGHFFTPLGVGSHLLRWGIEKSSITELDWWETASIDRIQIVATPARHFSGRGITDRNKTQWASWVIVGEREKIYFSGDSGYGPHFKEIGEKYGPFDFSMMECGQYNERWEAIHMLPEQTIQASLDVDSKSMMIIHWGAFNLSLHSWTEPVERALRAAQHQGVHMITPQIGQRFSPGSMPVNRRGREETNTWWILP